MRNSLIRRGALAVAAAMAALTVVAPSVPVSADPPPSASHTPAFHQTVAGAPGSHVAVASWQVQSSAVAQQSGGQISQVGYKAADWYVAPARSTVMATLLANGAFGRTNLFYSNNLATTVDPEMFQVPWWYRTTFTVPADSGRTVLRSFGLIPGADVWVNGHHVASRKTTDGAYVTNDVDVTSVVHAGVNAVAFAIPPTNPNQDFTMGWVDWNQTPPDNNMGIWRDVQIVRTGDVAISAPSVSTEFPAANRSVADLTVRETVDNHSASARSAAVMVKLTGHGAPITVSQRVTVPANGSRTVTFGSPAFPMLSLRNPAVWWPVGQGAHPIYDASATATVGGDLTDRSETTFGVRTVTSTIRPGGGRQFVVNGRVVPIRGGGWAPDMFLRDDPARTAAQLSYVADLGLNTIRLEGKLENPDFFDQADKAGIMVLAGWECCDKWEAWAGTGGAPWSEHDRTTAYRSAASEAVLLRDHPSVVAFLIGSDNAPPTDIAAGYVNALVSNGWDAPIVAAASDATSTATGPSGMKMNGPYAWVPPSYWYDTDPSLGGAVGFSSEISAGESIPRMATLKTFMSADDLRHLWQDPTMAQFHAGRTSTLFQNLSIYDKALTARYGAPTSASDYVRKAQLAGYEATRAQFEAYASKATASQPATGVIYWMLNSAWPSLHWNLYDYSLAQSGSYYGVKKADEPLHVQYDYNGNAQVVNHQPARMLGPFTVKMTMRNLDGSVRASSTHVVASVPANGTVAVPLPVATMSRTYFIELTLTNAKGVVVSRNVYWDSTRRDILDVDNSEWFYTPESQAADLTGLSTLRSASVRHGVKSTVIGGIETTTVTLRNVGSVPAVDVHTAVVAGAGGAEVLPVTWSDNDITLFPGQSIELTAHYAVSRLHGKNPVLTVDEFNS